MEKSNETYTLKYIDADTFLPESASNILKSKGYWSTTEDGWVELITRLEKRAVSVIKASVNINNLIDENPESLEELCILYVTFQLYNPLTHVEYSREDANDALEQFNELIDRIRDNQKEIGILADESSTKEVAGLFVFK